MAAVFDPKAKQAFADLYPSQFGSFSHALDAHPLLELEALAGLGEALPESSLEYNLGDLPVGIAGEDAPSNGLSIADTIRQIGDCGSWAVLKNIEQVPAYRDLLHELLAEIEPVIGQQTGAMLKRQGFIFVSSPGSMTPYHFDPEHNILLQIRGSKTMTVWPIADYRWASQQSHEAYHGGDSRNLEWRDEFLTEGQAHELHPGSAIYVPVMAPHFVRNGSEPSISLSITWRSEWSFAEADAHGFNRMMRRWGINPRPPAPFPASSMAKAYSWRALRKAGLVGR